LLDGVAGAEFAKVDTKEDEDYLVDSPTEGNDGEADYSRADSLLGTCKSSFVASREKPVEATPNKIAKGCNPGNDKGSGNGVADQVTDTGVAKKTGSLGSYVYESVVCSNYFLYHLYFISYLEKLVQ
jgi:hypothetical protein